MEGRDMLTPGRPAGLGEAGRPTIFSFQPTQPTPTSRQDQERPREGQLQTEEITGQPA